MPPNKSPWLGQLKNSRLVKQIDQDHSSDIAIVGGGIAGISTAYFLLTNTDKKVVLVEAGKIAHGATGHNAGQVIAAFERPLEDLIKEFGFAQALEGQKALDTTWSLLESIMSETNIQVPYYRFTGYNGMVDMGVIIRRLAKNFYLDHYGIQVEPMLVANTVTNLKDIPKEYRKYYRLVPPENILSLLETNKNQFIACQPDTKGVINSALFCEELLSYLEERYADRLHVLEHTPIKEIFFNAKGAALSVVGKDHAITAAKVVLCTNGFENITIKTEQGNAVDHKFHQMVHGEIGYMAAYVEKLDKPPIAISYLDYGKDDANDPYFYLTRRPYEHGGEIKNLISVGGPESLLPDRAVYDQNQAYLPRAAEEIDQFVHSTYHPAPNSAIDYEFRWHGLMGYTNTGVRLIGPEPELPSLLYNLGCNGIGIIPSIYGGWKVAEIIGGKSFPPAIFDPRQK